MTKIAWGRGFSLSPHGGSTNSETGYFDERKYDGLKSRPSPEYIEKTIHRLSVFADKPLKTLEDIQEAFDEHGDALVNNQAAHLQTWLKSQYNKQGN